MKIVFVDLQVNEFYVKNLSKIIAGRRAISKHRYLLDWFLENEVEVVNLVTLDGSTLPTNFLKKITRNYFFRKAEAQFVLKKSNVPKRSIRIIVDPKEINKDDIVLYYGTFYTSQFKNAQEIKGIKIIDHVHFFGDKQAAEKIKGKGISHYIFDVNLNKYSKIYQKNYSWFDGEFIMRPFTYQPRFCVQKNFSERKTKVVAMGTLTKCEIPDFIETYGSEYYQPRRKLIMDNASAYEMEIDSYISEWNEKPLKRIKDTDIVFLKLYKKIYNYFTSGRQKSYFSFDMVEKYNEYKMFICPEDIQGSYGIGVIEGMACGCAMIGWNYGAFEDMGMKAGKHYISYDGTMEDLIEKIRYYQKPENQVELENIAKTGCAFVRENFSQEKVAQNFYAALRKISEEELLNHNNV